MTELATVAKAGFKFDEFFGNIGHGLVGAGINFATQVVSNNQQAAMQKQHNADMASMQKQHDADMASMQKNHDATIAKLSSQIEQSQRQYEDLEKRWLAKEEKWERERQE